MIDHNEISHLAEQAVAMGDYVAADSFLQKMLYECTPEVGREILSDRNMALKILTEILLCEKNSGSGNTWRACGGYDGFFAAYQRIKRAVRRIWFGLDDEDIYEGFSSLCDISMTGDMLAVIAKYSVPPELWTDVFFRLADIDAIPAVSRDIIKGYLNAMQVNGISGNGRCYPMRIRQNALSVRRISYGEINENHGPAAGTANKNKLSIIYCTNDEDYAAECRKYLEYLNLPGGIQGEVIEVTGASSMAAGYNFAMRSTDAAYKLYIHHDTFLTDSNIPDKLLKVFSSENAPSMTGVFGTTKLPDSGRWANCPYEDSVLTLWQDAMLDFIRPQISPDLKVHPAEAIDGAFIATSTDIPWREDLFDDWHFYDISQCFEMRLAGYTTALISDTTPWILHESTLRKDPTDAYGRYCDIFKREYLS